MFLYTLLLAWMFAGPQAEAGGVTIVIDPFSPTYVPAPRPDYVWIAGSYDPYGNYTPGYWQPLAPRSGYLWVGGYWAGTVYHDGYWRPAGRAGQAWIDGYYLGGRYTPGRWVSEAEYAHARAEARSRRSAYHATAKPTSSHSTHSAASQSTRGASSSAHQAADGHGKKH